MAEQKEANAIVEMTAEKIATVTGFTPAEIAIVKRTVAKGTTDFELAYFLNIAKSVKLNPFNKEIWCYKDNRGNVLVFAGRDGFLKKAQQSPLWNGMTSSEVCANDVFEMDVAKAEITHKPNFKDRGEIIGAYAIVKPKGCELATVEWADIKIFDKKQNTWNTHKAEMIKKVAEVHALKKAFGITILQSEYDWQIKDDKVIPAVIDMRTPLEIIQEKILNALDEYTGKDKEEIRRSCVNAKQKGTFDEKFGREVAAILGVEL
jgi:recombinational DNA repair protein RecT